MAIIRLGHIVGGISGSVGSTNFVNARGATIARSRPFTSNRKSEKQLLRRSRYMIFRNQWLEMSNDDRDAWRTQAKQVPFRNRLGTPITLSGWQYFMSAALSLRQETTAMPSTPPKEIRPQPLRDFTADFTEGGPMLISTYNPSSTTPILLRLYVSRTMSNSIPIHFSTWTYSGWLTTGFPTRDWESNIQTAIGTLLSGEAIGLRMHLQIDGALLSTPLIRATIVS